MMGGINKIVLGTVQFGIPYGISNDHGQTSIDEVHKILRLCGISGINFIDTASFYGDSEKVLGSVIGNNNNFKIVTKTPVFKGKNINKKHISELNMLFEKSLVDLKCDHVYGLLVHNCNDLVKPGGEALIKALESLRSQGLVKKIGVSVYNPVQVEILLNEYDFDVVQLPVNIFDQRFIEKNTLGVLKQHGIEVHVRSIFLQGLLLMAAVSLPPYFEPIVSNFARLEMFLERNGIDRLGFLLGFVMSIKEIDRVVIGVNTVTQLEKIIRESVRDYSEFDYSQFALHDERYINPAKWEKK